MRYRRYSDHAETDHQCDVGHVKNSGADPTDADIHEINDPIVVEDPVEQISCAAG
jgi:hypothetical protein